MLEPKAIQALVGDRLRRRREYLGHSQQDMATRLGIDQSAVSRMERGSARMDMTVACRAADELGLRRSYLFARDFTESFHAVIGLVWEDVVSTSEEYPVQQAMQVAREELHVLRPEVLGLSLFLQVEPAPVFRYWTANPFRFASGVWDTREEAPRRIGLPETTRPLLEAWKERRILERTSPRFQPDNDRFPYSPDYILDVPLQHSMFGVGFQKKPEADARWWTRELGEALQVGALREIARAPA